MATVTGVPGTSIAAQCTIENPGAVVRQADDATSLQSVCNDLATIKAGSWTCSATVLCTGPWAWSGSGASVQIGTSVGFVQESDAAPFKLLGRSALKPARVPMADGNKKVSVKTGTGVDYAGARFTLPGNGAGTAVKRTITLDSTVNVPADGETMSFFCQNSTNTIDGSGIAYEFKNDGGGVIARVYWDTANVTNADVQDNFWLTFEADGGAWGLAENSGALSQFVSSAWHYRGVRVS